MSKDSKKNKKEEKDKDEVIKHNPEKNKQKTKKYKIKKHSKARRIIKITLLTLLFIIIIVSGIVIGKIYGVFKSAKLSMEDIIIKYENSIVKDADGNTIAELTGDQNRKVITLSEMSPYIPKAFVAIEDERFYDHEGVDIQRTVSATFKYALSKVGLGEANYGGSTITQQLVKNLTEEDDRTAERKIKEIARAYYLEKELSKPQILELYLNLIFLGDTASGVEVASNYYFSKTAKDLTLLESAFLAGINDGPNYYDAFSTEQEDIDKIKRKVKIVLDKMYELNQENSEHKAGITKEEYDAAVEELNNTGLVFKKGTIVDVMYSYHTEAAINQVKKELKEKNPDWTDEYVDYYVKSGGLTIYTTQNTNIQTVMEEEVKKDAYVTYSKEEKDENGNAIKAQAAMVLINHKNGHVLATVGGLGEKTTVFGQNRATQSTRSTGSAIKPLAVVAPGIDKGIITAATVFDDISYSSGQYVGYKNYGFAYKGLITVRYAIAASQNIPMLKGINRIGIDNSKEFLKSVGITTLSDEEDTGIAIALGGLYHGISPLEVAGAYAAIANDGVYIEPTFYTKVVDSEGNTVLTTEQETRTVMSSAAAYVVKEVLTEVVRSGAGGYTAISGISVAAKTGTSQEDYDRWYCGFTPYYTAATWYGFDIGETVVYSGNPAGKIWDGVMETIHEDLPNARFSDTRPNGVTTRSVCKNSGMLATELCKTDQRGSQVYTEYFVKGTEPTKSCTCHVQVDICLTSGLLATEFCTNKESKIFITRDPGETGNWQKAADAAYTLTITDTCNIHTKVEEPEEPEEPEPPVNSGNNTTGNNTTGNNTTGNNTTGNNTTGNNTTGNNTTGDNTTGNNTTGNNTTGNNITGNNTTGNNTTGNNTGDNTSGGGTSGGDGSGDSGSDNNTSGDNNSGNNSSQDATTVSSGTEDNNI